MSLRTISPEYLLGWGSVVLAQLKPGLILPLCPSVCLSELSFLGQKQPYEEVVGDQVQSCPLPAWHHKEHGWMVFLSFPVI